MRNLEKQPLLRRRAFQYFITGAITLAAFAILPLVVPIDWREVGRSLASFPAFTVAAVFGLNLLQHLLHVTRVFLLSAPGDRRFSRFFYAVTMGQAANIILPARAGDVLKAVLLGRTSRNPNDTAFSSGGLLVVDKAVDAGAFLLLTLIFGLHHQPMIAKALTFGSVGAVLLAITWFLGARLPGRMKITLPFPPALQRRFLEMGQGISSSLRNPMVLAALMAGLLVWGCEALMLWCLPRGLGFPISPAQAVFTLAVLVLGTAAPVSIGNLGTFEMAVLVGLQHCSVPANAAIAAAVAHHAIQSVSTACWSGVALLSRPTAAQPKLQAEGLA